MKNQRTFWKMPCKSHGGSLTRGKRKTARPISTEREIEEQVSRLARRFRVRVYRQVNVGNHIHLALRASSRREVQNFLRVLTQALMFLVAGARKGNLVGKFWHALACSRIVEWGRDWAGVKRYLEKN